jgi:ubiquinone/menaquinone biosynthesis C-methylase UbiE
MTDTQTADYQAITEVQQQIWSKGDFAAVGVKLQASAERLVDAVDIAPGERVLDVACGAGNAAIASARHFTDAVGLDYVPELLERARERTAAEHLEAEYVEGDAQDMPFDDASFDAVLSIYGAMFAPDQAKTAQELMRVTKPGGRIGMCNWTPEGVIGRMFKTVAQHAPPPPGAPSPLVWGTEDGVRELFGDGVSSLRTTKREIAMRYLSPDHYVDYFKQWFGPMVMAFQRLGDGPEADALRQDLVGVWSDANRSDSALIADCEYLEVVAVRA